MVSNEMPIRLRNLLSGQLLCVRSYDSRSKDSDCRWEMDDDILKSAAYITKEKKPDMRYILATTGQLDDSSLFKVCSIDTERVPEATAQVLYNRNVYFEHIKTKLTLGIHEKTVSSSVEADNDRIARPVDVSSAAVNRNSFALRGAAHV